MLVPKLEVFEIPRCEFDNTFFVAVIMFVKSVSQSQASEEVSGGVYDGAHMIKSTNHGL